MEARAWNIFGWADLFLAMKQGQAVFVHKDWDAFFPSAKLVRFCFHGAVQKDFLHHMMNYLSNEWSSSVT